MTLSACMSTPEEQVHRTTLTCCGVAVKVHVAPAARPGGVRSSLPGSLRLRLLDQLKRRCSYALLLIVAVLVLSSVARGHDMQRGQPRFPNTVSSLESPPSPASSLLADSQRSPPPSQVTPPLAEPVAVSAIGGSGDAGELRPYSRAELDWASATPSDGPKKCIFTRSSGERLASSTGGRSFSKACVIGERHSGTNFLSSLIDSNFFLDRAPKHSHPHARQKNPAARVGQGCLEHKHMPQRSDAAAAAAMADTVAIIIVRNVADWAAGMCKQPFEALLPNDVPLADCVPAAWIGDNMTSAVGAVDYENVLALRASKYGGWLALNWPHMHLVSYECLLADRGAGAISWMRWMEEEYGFPVLPLAAVGRQPTQPRVYKLPVRYGLHGFGPYGHGALNVSKLEEQSAVTATFAAARAMAAGGGVPHTQPANKALSAVETLFHLPQFNATHRAMEVLVLGYAGLVERAAMLPMAPPSPPRPPSPPPRPPSPPPRNRFLVADPGVRQPWQ